MDTLTTREIVLSLISIHDYAIFEVARFAKRKLRTKSIYKLTSFDFDECLSIAKTSPSAQFVLAKMFWVGIGCDRCVMSALGACKQSFENGFVPAILMMSQLRSLVKGDDESPSPLSLLELASAKKYPPAITHLAAAYEGGFLGLSASSEMARSLYKEAVDLDEPNALALSGGCHVSEGRFAEAIPLLERAAKQYHLGSNEMLAALYRTGHWGVSRDLQKSKRFLDHAAEIRLGNMDFLDE